jgi:hypothetical protein
MTYEEYQRASPDQQNEFEEIMIDLLVSQSPASDAWTTPVHAVDKAIRWQTSDTKKMLEALEKQGRISKRSEAINKFASPMTISKWWWERGKGS